AEIAELLGVIGSGERRLITVVGDWGTGKSSLVQAGVIPALKRQVAPAGAPEGWPASLKHSKTWGFVRMRPWDNPIGAFVHALTGLWYDDNSDSRRTGDDASWEFDLKTGGTLSRFLHVLDMCLLMRRGELPPRILLYIDHLDDLFARNDRHTIDRFATLLSEALT